MRDHLIRQSDLIPENILSRSILIVGAGAIGSFTCLQLAKMGFENIEIYDHDKVSVENMNCQFYRFSDIGSNKAEALKSLVKDFTGVTIAANPRKFESGCGVADVVIAAVDSMAAREMIWNECRGNEKVSYFVDPRMGALDASLYTAIPVDDEDCELYAKTLRSDEDSVQERCTAKSTIFTANLLSGLVAKTVVDCFNGKPLSSALWSVSHNQLVAFGR